MLEVVPRAVEVVAVLEEGVDDDVGRLAAVELDTGRLAAVGLVVVLAGEAGTFSLDTSGLDCSTSSLPESIVASTGVAGAASSTSASAATGIGSSVDAILINCNQQTGGGIRLSRGNATATSLTVQNRGLKKSRGRLAQDEQDNYELRLRRERHRAVLGSGEGPRRHAWL